jgi:hypothetical protein
MSLAQLFSLQPLDDVEAAPGRDAPGRDRSM